MAKKKRNVIDFKKEAGKRGKRLVKAKNTTNAEDIPTPFPGFLKLGYHQTQIIKILAEIIRDQRESAPWAIFCCSDLPDPDRPFSQDEIGKAWEIFQKWVSLGRERRRKREGST